MRIPQTFAVVVPVVFGVLLSGAMAQEKATTQASAEGKGADSTSGVALKGSDYLSPSDSAKSGFRGHIFDFAEDQKQIWTSPSRIRLSDANWLVPLGGISAGLFVTDREYSASLNQNPTTLKHYKTVSNIGIAGLIGGSASMYLLSFPKHNDRWRETGFLAGEAALNSLVTVEALKYSLGRERPYQGNGAGTFFRGGTSFPSEHAAAAWSVAGVLAHEYPGTFPKILAYGMASAVSFSRIHGRQHFPSDVLIGSAMGYLISQNIYRRHHDVELGGDSWESPHEFAGEPRIRSTSFMGSPYVPLDSWVYPAMERLAAVGYVKTSTIGMRPWTRMECARLLSEAAERQPDTDGPPQVRDLYDSLAQEFQSELGLADGEENLHTQVESVYSRAMGISGTPLTDNYHFGQSVLNDYGRPDRQGFNSISGASAWTTAGPFVIYARGEYEYSPSAPSPSGAALSFISSADGLPPNAPAMPLATVSHFQLLDAYVGMNLANWQVSFGKQSLWWGPGDEGAMLFTNNVAPLNKMFRINRVSPFHIPHFADIRMEFFIGQVEGQQFIDNGAVKQENAPGLQGQYGQTLARQPFLSGAKASLKFTPNFEFSVSKTTVYGGPGNPLTFNTFLKSSFSMHVNNFQLGDSRSAVDFSYRIPKLRDWLTFYGDAFQEDEISPLNRPYKSAFQTGIYLARLPKVSKLDLRIEGGTTSPVNFPSCNGCFYSNSQYLNGYTNNGIPIGTWLGRSSQGESARSTYWLSATKRIGIEVRHRKVDSEFLPQGGTQNDVAIHSDFVLKSGVRLSGMLQYEKWQIPLLAPNAQSNLTASFQVGFWPQVRRK